MITVFQRRHEITPARLRKLTRMSDIIMADDEQTGPSP
jgi:hypothetical protein